MGRQASSKQGLIIPLVLATATGIGLLSFGLPTTSQLAQRFDGAQSFVVKEWQSGVIQAHKASDVQAVIDLAPHLGADPSAELHWNDNARSAEIFVNSEPVLQGTVPDGFDADVLGDMLISVNDYYASAPPTAEREKRDGCWWSCVSCSASSSCVMCSSTGCHMDPNCASCSGLSACGCQ